MTFRASRPYITVHKEKRGAWGYENQLPWSFDVIKTISYWLVKVFSDKKLGKTNVRCKKRCVPPWYPAPKATS